MSPTMKVGFGISHQNSRIVTRINQDYDKTNVTCAVWSFVDVCGGCHISDIGDGPIWALTSQSCQPELRHGPP